MKIRYIFQTLLFAAPLISSCSDGIEAPVSKKGSYTIEAKISQGADNTKADLGEYDEDGGFYPVLWEKGDVIGVNTAQKGNPVFTAYTLSSGTGTQVATFAGTQEPIRYYDIQQIYFASYPQDPTSATVTGNDHKITLTYDIPATQTHEKGRDISAGIFPMMGFGLNYANLKFENLASVIRLNLKGDYTVKSVSIAPVDNAAGFAGSVYSTHNDVSLEPEFEATPTAGSSVTLDCSADPVKLEADNLTTFDFVVCPGTYNGGFVCTINKGDGTTVTKKYQLDFDLERSHMLEIGDEGTRFIVWLENPLNSTDPEETTAANDLDGRAISFKLKDGVKTALGWTAEWSEDGGTTWHSDGRPTDYAALNLKGVGCTSSYEPTDFKLGVQTYDTESDTDNTNRWTNALRAKGNSTETIDLSYRDYAGNVLSTRSTSNCYVVHQAGTYTFPAAIGNVVADGALNTTAFTSTATTAPTGTSILNPFIGVDQTSIQDKSGKAITSSTKVENVLVLPNVDNSPVQLEWDDYDNQINNISYKNGMITFTTADASSIHEGNAVISCTVKMKLNKDDITPVYWSWHIWITGQDLSKTFKTSDGVTMLPCNLGWYSTGAMVFKKTDILVRYTQDETGKQVTLNVKRPELVIPMGGNTLYQWGRMNALAGVKDNWNAENSSFEFSNGCGSKQSENPLYDVFDLPQDAISSSESKEIYDPNNSINRWNADNNIVYTGSNTTASDVVKTVYDPCPTGLVTPMGEAFKGISSSYVKLQGKDNLSDNVRLIKGVCLKDSEGNLQFFPIGSRQYSSFNTPQPNGVYWTASPAFYGGATGNLSGVAFKISGNASDAVDTRVWTMSAMSYDNHTSDLGSIRPMVQTPITPSTPTTIGAGINVDTPSNGSGDLDFGNSNLFDDPLE